MEGYEGIEIEREKRIFIKIQDWFIKYNIIFIFIIILLLSNFVSDAFLSKTNIFNLLRQLSALGVISLGMLLVILTGGIDLSVGSIMAFSNVLCAFLLAERSLPFFAAAIITVIIGSLIGSISGYLVAFRKIAPFISTLALMTIARGFAYILSKGTPIMVDNYILNQISKGYLLGVPIAIYILLLVFIITFLLLKFTVFGRMLIAIGSNEKVVELSGIQVNRYKLLVYSISGALCGLAGIISTSRTGVGSPLVGEGYELDAIAAVVIGGAAITGGKGSAFNSLIGVFILGIIGNIMNLMNIAAYPQQVIKGIIIVIAVLCQGIDHKK